LGPYLLLRPSAVIMLRRYAVAVPGRIRLEDDSGKPFRMTPENPNPPQICADPDGVVTDPVSSARRCAFTPSQRLHPLVPTSAEGGDDATGR